MKPSEMTGRGLLLLALFAGAGACQDAPHQQPSGDDPGRDHDGRERPRASVEPRIPAGRAHARDRASRPPALRRREGSALRADCRRARRSTHSARAGCWTSCSIRTSPRTRRSTSPTRSPATATPTARRSRARRLDGLRLTDVKVIFRQQPKIASGHHFGSRLVFARDGRLFVTLGERNKERDSAQDLGTHIGKIVRIGKDGTVPADNPFVGREGARPEIWSYGHRNVQGAALHPATGELWAHEHGPRGGDEINVVRGGPQLRLAGHHLWPRVPRARDRRGHRERGHGTAAALLGAVDRPVRHGVPQRQCVSRLEGAVVRRRARGQAAGPARARPGRAASVPKSALRSASACATCAKGPTARCTC